MIRKERVYNPETREFYWKEVEVPVLLALRGVRNDLADLVKVYDDIVLSKEGMS